MEMRRKDRELGREESLAILAKGTFGILATTGPDGWPYAVPVNYVSDEHFVYIHCALEGHKLQNLGHDEKVCFTVVTEAEVLPELFSTRYESAVIFGRASLIEDEEQKNAALRKMVDRFCPERREAGYEKAAKGLGVTAVVRIRMERITGKARRG